MRDETVVQKAVRPRIGDDDHGSPVTAVAAIGTGERLVLLTAHSGGAVATVTAFDMDRHPINEITHATTLLPRRNRFAAG